MSGETGLLDVALGPLWSAGAAQRFVYLYVEDGRKMNIVRYSHTEGAGGTSSRANTASRTVLWTDIDLTTWFTAKHYGGQLSFGPDGYMYLTQGGWIGMCPSG